jgi:hypothetical protein
MIRSTFFYIFFIAFFSIAKSQCLTDFQKLIPSPVKTADNEYGRTIALYDDYMAVGANWSDTLAYRAGIVYLYKYSAGKWNFVKLLKPNVTKQFLYFGVSVGMSRDYIVVAAAGYGGSIYVFKKPASGWESLTNESGILKMGRDVIFNDESSIAISENQNSIIACDFYSGGGNCYSFVKSNLSSWTNRSNPDQVLNNPDGYSPYFGASVATKDSTLVIGDQISVDGKGAVFVYQFKKTQNKYVLRSRLKSDLNGFSLGFRTIIHEDGIFTTFYEKTQQSQNVKILFYPKPLNGIWINSNQVCSFSPKQTDIPAYFPMSLSTADGNIFFAYSNKEIEIGEMIRVSKGSSSWCAPNYQLLSTNKYPIYYGFKMAAHSNKVATTLASSVDQRANHIAVDAVSETANGWINQRVATLRNNTRDHFFGSAILLHQDYLFTSAPADNSLRQDAGKVYISMLKGTKWVNSGALYPELNDAQSRSFGLSLAAFEDELAILNGSKTISIFQNKGDWNHSTLFQTIQVPDNVHNTFIGGNSAMSMNDKWLVITAINSEAGEKNSLIIYEKVQRKWVYHQQIITNYRIPLSFNFMSVDLDSNLIAFGDTSYIKGGIVYLIKLSPSNQWEIKYQLEPSSYGNQIGLNRAEFGSSVDIEGDHIFVGTPGYDTNSISNLGAVFVYAKPFSGWKSMTESSVIYPKNKLPMTLFGISVKALSNLLMIGAPGSDVYTDGIATGPPGDLHVYQGWNYKWTQNIPFLTLQGDTFKNDNYGLTSTLNKDFLFIGAPSENLPTGLNSGSVYATKMPPLVKLVPPVCTNSGNVNLFGYPYGGVWSGKGIVDSETGEFDPQLAGTGIHELTYITPNCFYPGKLQIEVKPPIIIIPLNDPTVFICQSPSSIKMIGVQLVDNQTYKWFYRSKSTDPFVFTGKETADFSAVDVGEYYVQVSNEYCSVNSPIMNVVYEVVDIQINPVPPICNQTLSFINLMASPSGGRWSGSNVSVTGLLKTQELTRGDHTFTYQIQSISNCTFTKSIVISKDPLFDVKLVIIGDLCGDVPVELMAQPAPSGNYQWFRFNEQFNTYELVSSGNDLKIINVETKGKYYLQIENAICSTKSLEMEVNKRPQDSVFIANVITPNGDGKNDVLTINGNIDNYSLKVINRYGAEVFYSNDKQPWDGKEVASGVYFWIVNYIDCFAKEATIKGWVHVILGD